MKIFPLKNPYIKSREYGIPQFIIRMSWGNRPHFMNGWVSKGNIYFRTKSSQNIQIVFMNYTDDKSRDVKKGGKCNIFR